MKKMALFIMALFSLMSYPLYSKPDSNGFDDIESLNKFDLLNRIDEIRLADNTIIIVANSNDCFKCSLPINKVLNDQRVGGIDKFIISDEYVTVKSLSVNMKVPPKYLVDPDVVDSLSEDPRSYLILKKNNTYSRFDLDNLDSFFLEVSDENEFTNCSYDVQFVDTVFSSAYLHRAIFKQGIVVFDKKSQNWANIRGMDIIYNGNNPLDSNLVYLLPSRVNSQEYEIFKSYGEMLDYSKKINVPILSVNGIFFKDSLLCVSFLLNRYYKKRADSSNISVYTTYFIGTKKIKDINDFLLASDLNSYNNYFFADLIQIDGIRYPIRIFSPINVESNHELVLRVNKADDEKQTSDFFGEVKVKLDFENSKLNPSTLTKLEDMVDYISDESIIENCKINIRKEMTDRNRNIGNLIVTSQ